MLFTDYPSADDAVGRASAALGVDLDVALDVAAALAGVVHAVVAGGAELVRRVLSRRRGRRRVHAVVGVFAFHAVLLGVGGLRNTGGPMTLPIKSIANCLFYARFKLLWGGCG